ncbi:putative ribosome biogenesis GTPase RsgA [Pseudoclavibacter endophyticus]|uniref:Small ribosomal subunit biogenesis GTPase RsgA n=1 Tax=Pseudoclavibacter endophyticus TaxID=1778590 RepID=A0A6H9WT40_9MICO|nr:ribosome small subunit-dependent GTPase A [Pseudoclavibacter endophyticus]KAB1649855.1 ribosome small subunit-dependent GTPase A [Pseudoclavibacter endophyticus]GGA59256.1 putative ribosome biogenesis GTPase RsgA [Pseudoclavibacter endophyticus]
MTAGRADAFEQYGDWDEDDVRVRPNPKSNRPRSKQRPEHADAIPGLVVTVDRGRATVLVADDGRPVSVDTVPGLAADRAGTRDGAGAASERVRAVTAARARELGRQRIVTGDVVDLVGDVTGAPGTLARIVRIHNRKTLLRRSADDTDQIERVIVANADRLCIVAATVDPEPRPRLIDRCIVAALDAGIEPMLLLTKTDLKAANELRALVEPLGVPIFESQRAAAPVDELRSAIAGTTTVLVGHSGVGKSTIVNLLVPNAEREVGRVNDVTGRGRHTSSSSVALPVVDARGRGGWIIDTPGVRSFGLGHVSHDSVLRGFSDLAAIADDCPRGCTHRVDAPDCELDEAVRDGRLDARGADRLESLRRLFVSLETAEDEWRS